MTDAQISDEAPLQLQELLDGFGVTLFEIALMTGVGADEIKVYQFRHQLGVEDTTGSDDALGKSITQYHGLMTRLRNRCWIEPENIRAFLIGRSAYVNEQRPAMLWREGFRELVTEAAIAYATSETPAEFLERHEIIPSVPEEPL